MYNSDVFLKNMCSNVLLLRGAVAPGLANCRGGGFRSTPFGLQRLIHGRWAGQGSGMYWWRKAASYSVHPNGRLTVLFKPGSASANYVNTVQKLIGLYYAATINKNLWIKPLTTMEFPISKGGGLHLSGINLRLPCVSVIFTFYLLW